MFLAVILINYLAVFFIYLTRKIIWQEYIYLKCTKKFNTCIKEIFIIK